jgi:hypothetical protein
VANAFYRGAEPRASPAVPSAYGIHATPGYPVTVMEGLAFRFRGK